RSLGRKGVPELSLTLASPEEAVRRLKLALSGITGEIEQVMPDDAVRKGEGRVKLRWEKDPFDAAITWEGGTGEVRLRDAATHSFAAYARLPAPDVAYFSDRVVEEVASEHRLAPPDFT